MAIRINLLAEAQAAEEMRRKDPVKRGIWIGGFCVAVVLIWILKLQLDIGINKSHYNAIEQSWNADKARYGTVTNNMVRIAEANKKLSELDRLATNRFYWAPVLNALQQTVTDDIQVIKLTGEQKYTKEDAKVIGSGDSKIVLPGAIVEKTSLYIDAKDYDPNAQNYDKFKEKLSASSYFVKLLGPRNSFILDGTLSAPTVDPSDPSRQFVVFKLAAHFQEVRHSE
jgi:hypothetical protein